MFTPSSTLSQGELDELKHFSRHGVGEDKTSDYFIKREKAIAYVYVINNKVVTLTHDLIYQHESYNDFSGGYARRYKLIPESIILGCAKDIIFEFKEHFSIPDRTIFLVQVQSSIIEASSSEDDNADEDNESIGSVTGQGIHTDGLSNAMVLCIERSNVEGAANSFYKDLQGDEQIGEERELEEGDAVFFHDDKVFHYVSRAMSRDMTKPMRRAVMLIHSPAEHIMTGSIFSGNLRGSNRTSSVSLRDLFEDDDEKKEENIIHAEQT